MKLIISFICAAGLISNVAAQELSKSELPSLVLNAFQEEFPKGTDTEWEQEGDLYKCEFEIGKYEHEVWIDKSGNLKKHEEEISKDDLPAAITQKLKSDFKDYSIDDVDKVDTDGKTVFRVELDRNADDREVLFSPDGSIVQGLN